ncbi:MAG TPA: DUF2252 family protein [Candidatus Angelobacter sp.]|nr:DUF2252 family protein [Candidatus Angelobacter sp.]
MNIFKATADFEQWLAKRLPIVRQDIVLKHQHMAEAAFPFFRATFYRWVQHWPEVCPDLAKAPAVLAVGDLHVENFGTWRDEEGRLIWGVNDLDEAWPCSYAIDLVRLTTSAYLAIDGEHLCVARREAAEAVEEGYRDALAAGGKALVLAEHHQWLRLLALSKMRDPVRFWERMQQCPPYTAKPPAEARKLIEETLPGPCKTYQLKRRIAGLGSLGHPRILALSTWQGAFIAREAKGIRTSAWAWYRNSSAEEIYGAKLASDAIRVQDPCVRFHGHWLVRRLAPDCSRIELAAIPKERDEARLLYDMGWETANMHFGSPAAIAKVKRDLAARRGRWLHKAAKSMFKVTLKDWETWRRSWKKEAK